MTQAKLNHGVVELPAEQREKLALFVQLHGEARAVEEFGLSRLTVARALAGLGLRRGSAALVAQRLGQLADR